MVGGKSIDRIPDFEVADIHRKFACWMQQRCRDNPKFIHELADVTFASEDTVKRWRKGHPPGFEAMLRALAYSGPAALNEVLLEPLGMTGARWVEDSPVLGGSYVAVRALRGARAKLREHPNDDIADLSTDAVLAAIDEATALLRELLELRRVRASADVVQMSDRERRA